MKTLNKTLLIALGITLSLSACKDEYKDVVPSEYNTILGFKNAGKKTVKLYKTGSDGSFTITILKGGTNTESTPEAAINVMSEEDLLIYGDGAGVKYTLLPSSMYEISDPNMHFKSDEMYINKKITFKTNEVEKFITANPNVVLPIELTSATDSVNSNNKLFLLSMDVLTPTLSFNRSNNGALLELHSADASNSQDVSLSLPFESDWDFGATIAIDKEKIESNASKYVPYELITLSNEGKAQFTTGNKQSSLIQVSVKNSDIVGVYTVPLMLKECSLDWMNLDKEPYNIKVEANKIHLTADQLSTNAQEPSEGAIAGAVDGDPKTYFHSAWSKSINTLHYFEIKLKEPITKAFKFGFIGRSNNNAGDIKRAKVEVSNDGTAWRQVAEVSFDLKPVFGGTYYCSTIKLDAAADYIRITPLETADSRILATSNQKFFYFAEFMLYGK